MTTTAPIAHGHWSSRLSFLLATIGLSMGLVVPESHPGYRLWAALIRFPVPATIVVLIAAALFGLGETVG